MGIAPGSSQKLAFRDIRYISRIVPQETSIITSDTEYISSEIHTDVAGRQQMPEDPLAASLIAFRFLHVRFPAKFHQLGSQIWLPSTKKSVDYQSLKYRAVTRYNLSLLSQFLRHKYLPHIYLLWECGRYVRLSFLRRECAPSILFGKYRT